MSEIVLTIVLITFFGIFAFYFYYHPNSRNKKLFRESISRDVFFMSFIAPLFAAALFSFLISFTFKESDRGTFYKSDVAILTSVFYLYGVLAASQGIHALAKAFKPQIVRIKDQKLMRLIRFFHGPFSHLVGNVSLTLIVSLFLVYNVNHPAREALSQLETLIILICGAVIGFGLTINFAIGNNLKIMRWLLAIIVPTLVLIEFRSIDEILRSPLSILVLTTFITSLTIMLFDYFGPKKNWFMQKVDSKIGSVEKDWSSVFQQFKE